MKSLIDQKPETVLSRVEKMEYKWVLIGGFLLTFLGGNINVMMLSFFHVPVSHMTGAFSHLSMVYGGGIDTSNSMLSLWIVIAFFMGTIISGIIIGKEAIFPGNRYSTTLLLEALLLLVAGLMIQSENQYGVTLAAMACGIQNAMASTYLGLNIRTTHVSGIVTDLGLAFGHFVRGHSIGRLKIGLLISLLLGFFLGGLFAAFLFLKGGPWTIIIPSLMAFLIALGYWGMRKKQWL